MSEYMRLASYMQKIGTHVPKRMKEEMSASNILSIDFTIADILAEIIDGPEIPYNPSEVEAYYSEMSGHASTSTSQYSSMPTPTSKLNEEVAEFFAMARAERAQMGGMGGKVERRRTMRVRVRKVK